MQHSACWLGFPFFSPQFFLGERMKGKKKHKQGGNVKLKELKNYNEEKKEKEKNIRNKTLKTSNVLSGPVRSQRLDSMMLMGPIELGISHGSEIQS